MSNIVIEIQYASGKSELVDIDAQRVLVGSGAHCDVRMPLQAAANEHILIEVVGETVRVQALAASPPTIVDGNVVAQAVIAPGSVISIGDTQLRISLSSSLESDEAAKARKKKEASASAVRIGGVAMLCIGGFIMMRLAEPKAVPEPRQAPPLFSDAPIECPAKQASQAQLLGNKKRIAADGARERHPFYIAEGVESVQLYKLAAACYAAAKENALATELENMAAVLRAEVEDDARVRRLRLGRAAAGGDAEVAKREVVALRVLYKGKDGPYVSWLNSLARFYNVDKD